MKQFRFNNAQGGNMKLNFLNAGELKRTAPEHNLENAVAYQKRKLAKAISQIKKGSTPKPNPLVSRNGEPTIVLKFANHTIGGFPLGDMLIEEALTEIKDIWLETDEAQQLVWKVHQEMTEALAKAKIKNV